MFVQFGHRRVGRLRTGGYIHCTVQVGRNHAGLVTSIVTGLAGKRKVVGMPGCPSWLRTRVNDCVKEKKWYIVLEDHPDPW